MLDVHCQQMMQWKKRCPWIFGMDRKRLTSWSTKNEDGVSYLSHKDGNVQKVGEVRKVNNNSNRVCISRGCTKADT